MVDIERLISDKRKLISNKRFFTSDVLRKHLRSMATIMLQRYKVRHPVYVRIAYGSPSVRTAQTDGFNIVINANADIVKIQPDRQKKYVIVKAFLYHETGHIMYSDFNIMQKYQYKIIKGKIPYASSVSTEYAEALEKITEYLNSGDTNKRRGAFNKMAMEIENVLEDAYIEARLKQRYPGSVKHVIDYMRAVSYMSVPSLEEHIAKENGDKYDALIDLMLAYAVNGSYIPFQDDDDERILAIDACIPYIDAAVYSGKAVVRYTQLNNIIFELWPYLYEYLENPNRNHEQDQQRETPNHTAIPTGSTKDFEEGNEIENRNGDEKNERADKSARVHSPRSKGSEENKTAAEDSDGEETNGGADSDEPKDKADGVDYSPKDELLLLDEDDGGLYHEDYEADAALNSADELNRLIDEMREVDACAENEEIWEKSLNEFSNGIEYMDIHKGVPVYVMRMASIPYENELQYEEVCDYVESLADKLTYSLRSVFTDIQKGAKRKNRLIGKKIRAASLFRLDQRIFYDTKLPCDVGVCIGHLGDESGSMDSDERYRYVRLASLVIYNFCRKLNIPAGFYGHTADEKEWPSVSMRAYSEFRKIDDKDKFRMMDITARGNNRDGAAIQYMCERLLEQPEPMKILFITCDGQPMAYGYSGAPANDDVTSVVEHYEKRGVIFYALAIGDDKDRIQSMYGNRFVDITNLSELPERLGELMSRQLKRAV